MPACVKCGHDPDAAVRASWTFDIGREVKSMNSRDVNGKRGWVYRVARAAWERDMISWRRACRIPIAVSRRRVTLTRLYGYRQRELDPDNLVGGLKACVDAMVEAGLLLGDTKAKAEIHYAQFKSPDFGLRVLIEELA